MFGVGGRVAATLELQRERLSTPYSSAMTKRMMCCAAAQSPSAVDASSPAITAKRRTVMAERKTEVRRRFKGFSGPLNASAPLRLFVTEAIRVF